MTDTPPLMSQMSPRSTPDALKLNDMLRSDILDWHALGLFTDLDRDQSTLNCYWAGKNRSGTKDDLPFNDKSTGWPGAPDGESRISGQIVNENVDLRMLTWFMGERVVKPRDVMDQEATRKSAAWRYTLAYELDQTLTDRVDSLELLWHCVDGLGYGVWKEGWRQRNRIGSKIARFSDLAALTVQRGQDMATEAYVQLPANAAEMTATTLLLMMQQPDMKAEMIQRITELDPAMSPEEAGKVLLQWRKGNLEGAEYFAPIPMPGCAAPRALVPGIDCIFPGMMQNTRAGRYWELEWITEGEVLSRSAAEGWTTDWTDQLLQNPGMVVDWNTLRLRYTGFELNGLGYGYQINTNALRNAGMYQIANLWQTGVDKAGREAPYRTLVHGQIPGYGLHECDPYATGRLPVLFVRRECRSNVAASSRGVAREMLTNQLIEKQTSDLLTMNTQLVGFPPVLETPDMGGDGLRPLARMAAPRDWFRSTGGRGLFAEVPDGSAAAIRGLEWNRKRVDDFYQRGPDADPDLKRARRMRIMHRTSGFYSEMLTLLCLNVQQDLRGSRLNIGSIGGVTVNAIINGDDLAGELDVSFNCDVSVADMELAEMKNEMVMKTIGLFRKGEADFGRVGRIILGRIDPEMLNSAVMTVEAGQAQEHEEIKRLINDVVCGNIVIDPNNPPPKAGDPQLRIQDIQQWMSIPENQQMMQQRPLLTEQMEKLLGIYQFQIDQYQDNAAIGRDWGVNPELKNLGGGGAQQPMQMPAAA